MFLPDQRGDPFALRYRKLTALIARSRFRLPDSIRNLSAACLVDRGGIEVLAHQQQKYAIEWRAEIDLAEPLAAPAAGQDAASLGLKPLTVAVPNSNASTGDFTSAEMGSITSAATRHVIQALQGQRDRRGATWVPFQFPGLVWGDCPAARCGGAGTGARDQEQG